MDIRHHYIEKGQGPPLILLHGNGGDCRYFRGQMDAFAQCCRVFALDARGHGKTPRGEKAPSIRQFAEDLLGFMDEHHLEKAHLLGFSDGGNTAMCFALRHPGRVDRLILNGANLSPAGVKRTTQLPIELGYRIAKSFSGRSASARANAELLGLMVNEPNIRPEELAAIQAETLLIAGTKDIIRRSHTELIAKLIPNSRLVLILGGHFIASRRPAAFNRAVLDFLQEERPA